MDSLQALLSLYQQKKSNVPDLPNGSDPKSHKALAENK